MASFVGVACCFLCRCPLSMELSTPPQSAPADEPFQESIETKKHYLGMSCSFIVLPWSSEGTILFSSTWWLKHFKFAIGCPLHYFLSAASRRGLSPTLSTLHESFLAAPLGHLYESIETTKRSYYLGMRCSFIVLSLSSERTILFSSACGLKHFKGTPHTCRSLAFHRYFTSI
ncbi:hypothetical protein NDU88_001680 [Pleurodeles waltl]|uniref:Secreted protein n=1 Tax=Pleurodeles waltl TaxID=8319 RepID=A0AAV7UU13_PLEWA|nr:hypothetical protein NDU88_001680 [Pleurodeles waltl]